MSTKGLDSILQSIHAKPEQKILRDRYLSLVSELSDQTEKNRRILELAHIVQASDPTQAMNLGHLVYRQDRKSEDALTLIHSCLVTLGRHGKASMVQAELEKVRSSKLPPVPDTEKATQGPEPVDQSQDGTFKIGEQDAAVDAATVVFEPTKPLPPPDPPELPNLPDGRSAPEPIDATVVLNTEPQESGTPGFSIQPSTPDIPITFSVPGSSEQEEEAAEDIGTFDIPSLTQMQRELIDIRQKEVPPVLPEPDLSLNEDRDQSIEKEIPDDFLAPVTRTIKTRSPDSVDQSPESAPVEVTDPTDEITPAPGSFEQSLKQPSEGTPVETLSDSTPSFETKTKLQLNGPVKDAGSEAETEAKAEAKEASEFSGQMSNFANQFEQIFKYGMTVPTKPLSEESMVTLSQPFKKALEHWFRKATSSKGQDYVTGVISELALAIWQSSPDKEGATFLGRSGLYHTSPGLWGLWLDCLIISGLHRKALHEIRHLILNTSKRDDTWLHCSWNRYKQTLNQMGYTIREDWTVSDGIEKLKAILIRMPEAGAGAWIP